MPELPEVETVARELRPRVVGQRIAGVRVGNKSLRRPWILGWSARLLGQQIETIDRRGKWLVFGLECGCFLAFHLGMTGRLTVHANGERVAAHTHLVFRFENDSEMRFNDARRFGSATLFVDAKSLDRFFQDSRLGPEPFELGRAYWRARLANTRRCLKAVLLDQTVVAGVGNIYADESLFEARVHPGRLGPQLEKLDVDRLRKAVVRVLRRAIDKRGSSIRNYVGGSGLKGGYQDEFRVYGRTGKPCSRCRTPIERIRLAGRSTHFCPNCQRSSRQQTAGSRQ